MLSLKRPVADLCIVCSDFGESVHFYRELLGFEEVLDIRIPEETATGAQLAPRAFRQIRVKAGETLIKLMEIESPPKPRTGEFQAGVRWLTFIVDDVPATMKKLQAKGVDFMSDPLRAPDAEWIVCAKGPDGMLIELVQPFDE
ncbi:MAG: VOC family protein [Pirellulales bacterium]|nr:VOC family protein [Pirellulales bacterium]